VNTYGKDPAALRALDPTLTSTYGTEVFVDIYYDTPSLDLFARQCSVRHRQRVNLTDPGDAKSGRELVQIKINAISDVAQQRAELKFKVERSARVKAQDDAHPVVGIIKPDQRNEFRARVRELGVNADSLQEIVTIEDTRRRLYISSRGKPFMSISHDTVQSSLLWANLRIIEIEPELNEIAFTEANDDKRRHMRDIGNRISEALIARFPQIHRDLTPKYNKAVLAFEQQVPMLRTLLRADIRRTQDVAAIGAVVLAALIVASTQFVKRMRRRPDRPQQSSPIARLEHRC
jgi:hypothetical protein